MQCVRISEMVENFKMIQEGKDCNLQTPKGFGKGRKRIQVFEGFVEREWEIFWVFNGGGLMGFLLGANV